MSAHLRSERYDVVVIGAGASGVAAAASAAQNGARTLLVDAGPSVGGEMISGLNLLGMIACNGEWIVGGTAKTFLDRCAALGGYIGQVCDFRPLHFVAFDPEIMKVAINAVLHDAGVELRLYSFAEEVYVENGRIEGIILVNKQGRTLIRANSFIDCTGDADIAVAAGVDYEAGDPASGAFQSMTMIFRMIGVETANLLRFLERNPENFAISEAPFRSLALPRDEAVRKIVEQGQPKVSISAKGPLLGAAIDRGEMYETSLIAIAPLSVARKEVSVNSTKVSNINATDTRALSNAYVVLLDQAIACATFLKLNVPGFENAEFSGLAPRIGIRETRRIKGQEVLTGDHVISAHRHDEGIARGGHPVDVWQAGRDSHWQVIKGGSYYDIPFGVMVPNNLDNLLVAGRCLSSTREGQSSARVMGTCMAMGQAAGTAAAMAEITNTRTTSFRDLPVERLRRRLVEQGALV
uniref:Glucose-inhibited division protein A n=1 Tax=Chelativorans sp. (strain BNC1) TaxID=266779 RepID=Q11FZ2_CHESB